MAKTAQEKYLDQEKKKEEKKKTTTKKSNPKFVCRVCGKSKTTPNYYQTTNPEVDKLGIMSICKDCCKEMFKDRYKENLLTLQKEEALKDAILHMCKIMDMVFSEEIYEVFEKDYTEMERNGNLYEDIGAWIGIYKKIIHREESKRSIAEGLKFTDSPMFKIGYERKSNQIKSNSVGEDIVAKWGDGFSKEEYKAMEKKYEFLSENYGMETNLHVEALKTYIRYKVKEEFATAEGRIKDAKDWGGLAEKAQKAAKLSPSQFSKADLQGGINTFSEYFAATEKEGVVLSWFRYEPIDSADFILWCHSNMNRKIFDKPTLTYEEVYSYYDELKNKYIESTGDPYKIFEDDTTEANRERAKAFIEKAIAIDNDAGLQ